MFARKLGYLLIPWLLAATSCGGAAAQNTAVVQIEGAASAKPLEIEEITLHEPDETPLEGDVRIDGDEFSSSAVVVFYVNSMAKSVKIESFKRILKHTEVLEKRDNRVVLWKVEYDTATQSVTFAGRDRPSPEMPELKKPYLIDLRGPKARVTDAQGHELPKAERDAVVQLEVTKRKKRAAQQARRPAGSSRDSARPKAPTHQARIGDDLPWVAQYLERELTLEESKSTWDAEVTRARLMAIYDIDGDPCAVVYIAMRLMHDESEGSHTTMQLEGQVVMRASDGLLVGMTLSGPQRIKGSVEVNGEQLDYGGRGTVKLRIRRRWEVRGK